MVPEAVTSSGIMFPAVPPWIAPIEEHAEPVGSFSRLITLCTSTTKRAAIITGSMVSLRRRAVATAAVEGHGQAVGSWSDPTPAR